MAIKNLLLVSYCYCFYCFCVSATTYSCTFPDDSDCSWDLLGDLKSYNTSPKSQHPEIETTGKLMALTEHKISDAQTLFAGSLRNLSQTSKLAAKNGNENVRMLTCNGRQT